MGVSNFFRNLRRSIKERNDLVREAILLQKQHSQMMKDLDNKISNADTKEEREELVAFKQQIIDEGKRVRAEEERKMKKPQK